VSSELDKLSIQNALRKLISLQAVVNNCKLQLLTKPKWTISPQYNDNTKIDGVKRKKKRSVF